MTFGINIRIGGRPGIWLGGAVFALVGLLILLAAPPPVPWGPDHSTDRLVMRILGWFFLTFGVVIVVAMAVNLAIGSRRPEAREEWGSWVNFLAGILGALAFAVPATLALPFYLVAYARRPNALFPAGASPRLNLVVAGAFSLLGLLALLLIAVMVRATLRGRRRHQRHGTGAPQSRPDPRR